MTKRSGSPRIRLVLISFDLSNELGLSVGRWTLASDAPNTQMEQGGFDETIPSFEFRQSP